MRIIRTLFIASVMALCLISCEKKNEPVLQEQAANEEPAANMDGSGIIPAELKFSAADLDGNTITDGIFKNYDVTLVNIWGTFCMPCLMELPELEQAYKEYAAKNCNVIALSVDVTPGDMEALNTAKKIWKDSCCTFPAIQTAPELEPIYSKLTAFPSTFLVDRNGKMIEGSYREGSLNRQKFEALFEYGLNFTGNAVKK